MTIDELQDLILKFASHNMNFLGAVVRPLNSYNVKNHFDPKNQSDYQKSGLYAYFADSDREVLYVGIAQDFGSRLYQHMQKNMGDWTTYVDGVLFPKSDLLRRSLSDSQQKSIQNGSFSVQYFEVEPYNYAALFEVFVIIKANPACNIQHADTLHFR